MGLSSFSTSASRYPVVGWRDPGRRSLREEEGAGKAFQAKIRRNHCGFFAFVSSAGSIVLAGLCLT